LPNTKTPAVTGVLASFISPWQSVARTEKSGGGGNRTRVPRYFHDSFYVYSRLFILTHAGPQSTGFQVGDAGTGLIHGVPAVTVNDPELVTSLQDSPAKSIGQGYLYLGSQYEVILST